MSHFRLEAQREIDELRKDAEVFTTIYKLLAARIREQEHVKRERPLHMAPEAQAVMGSVELCVWSLDTRITHYLNAVRQLEENEQNERVQPKPSSSAVFSLDEYRNRRGHRQRGDNGTEPHGSTCDSSGTDEASSESSGERLGAQNCEATEGDRMEERTVVVDSEDSKGICGQGD